MGGRRVTVWDQVGLALVLVFAAWAVLSSGVAGGDPVALLGMVTIAAVAFVLGRLVRPDAVPFWAVVLAAVVAVAGLAGGVSAFSGSPTAPPLGYGNANGALYTLGASAAAVAAIGLQGRWTQAAAWVLAVVLVVWTFITTSYAAAGLAAVVIMVALVASRIRRRVLLVAPAAVLVSITATIVIGASGAWGREVAEAVGLTARRADLWHDALMLMADHPVFGVGPDRFALESSTARSDADTPWAHSVYLQVGAETGVPGALILLAIVGWVLVTLIRAASVNRAAVVGVTVVAAFAIHASIDYVARFPVLVGIVAAIGGLTAAPWPLSETFTDRGS